MCALLQAGGTDRQGALTGRGHSQAEGKEATGLKGSYKRGYCTRNNQYREAS